MFHKKLKKMPYSGPDAILLYWLLQLYLAARIYSRLQM
jgi:hypothetical protein